MPFGLNKKNSAKVIAENCPDKYQSRWNLYRSISTWDCYKIKNEKLLGFKKKLYIYMDPKGHRQIFFTNKKSLFCKVQRIKKEKAQMKHCILQGCDPKQILDLQFFLPVGSLMWIFCRLNFPFLLGGWGLSVPEGATKYMFNSRWTIFISRSCSSRSLSLRYSSCSLCCSVARVNASSRLHNSWIAWDTKRYTIFNFVNKKN